MHPSQNVAHLNRIVLNVATIIFSIMTILLSGQEHFFLLGSRRAVLLWLIIHKQTFNIPPFQVKQQQQQQQQQEQQRGRQRPSYRIEKCSNRNEEKERNSSSESRSFCRTGERRSSMQRRIKSCLCSTSRVRFFSGTKLILEAWTWKFLYFKIGIRVVLEALKRQLVLSG